MFRNRGFIVRLAPKDMNTPEDVPEVMSLDPEKIKDLVTHTAKTVVVAFGVMVAMRTASQILINAAPKQ
jgi:hypothetical protein